MCRGWRRVTLARSGERARPTGVLVSRKRQVSKDGQQFAMVCSDRRVRVFKFGPAKLRRVYDESLEAANEVQRGGAEMFQVGRRADTGVSGMAFGRLDMRWGVVQRERRAGSCDEATRVSQVRHLERQATDGCGSSLHCCPCHALTESVCPRMGRTVCLPCLGSALLDLIAYSAHDSRPPLFRILSRLITLSYHTQLEDIDFGRRVAVERELAASASEGHAAPAAVFDESGQLLLYPTLLGVKVVNLVSNKVVRILGEWGAYRCGLAGEDGAARRTGDSARLAASGCPLHQPALCTLTQPPKPYRYCTSSKS